MRIMRGAANLAGFTLVIGFLGGCDSAPGVSDSGGTPPVVSGLEYSPDVIVFELIPDDDIVGDTLVVVDVSISASVTDEDGDVETVSYLVNNPFDPFEPLASGEMARVGNSSRYEGTATLEIPRGNTGIYTLIVSAVDSDVSVSNQVRGLVEYELQGGDPPVIERVIGPESVSPPTTFSYVATVTDPDGLGNISSVVARTPGGTYELRDDGDRDGLSGDMIAGDGNFTVTFQAPEGTPPGTVQFEFQAFDRQGHESNIIVRDLTVN